MTGEDGQNNCTGPTNQSENIRVAVRLRPFTEKETKRNNRRIVAIEKNTVVLYNPTYGDVNLKKFTFDYSYWSHDGFKKDPSGVNVPDPDHTHGSKYVSQERVFEDLGRFLLENALEGYNSALLAYGPTGSGKSYTVSGYGSNEGILPRFARALFAELDRKAEPLSPKQIDVEETKNTSLELEQEQILSPEESESKQSADSSQSNNRYEVFFSMIEVYNEVVRDLLAKSTEDLVGQPALGRRGLKVREHPKHGFFVENLTSYACADKNDIERRIEEGQLNKSIAATSMNETSSRGHTIYEFRIKQYKLKSPESPEEILTTSMVQLVDLAGSERMAVHVTGQLGYDSFVGKRSNSPYPITAGEKPTRGGSTKVGSASASSTATQSSAMSKRNMQSSSITNNYQKRFKESVSINQSLSALGNCIQVMSQYSQQLENRPAHADRRPAPKIPYRDSVLTKLLNRCCLSGNSKLVIIATLSPVETNYEDTLSTLRFADRAKQIRTHATVNRMSRSEIVDNLQRENERLKQIVDGRITRSDDSSQTSNFDDTENMMENFTGSRILNKSGNSDGVATRRSRTTVRRNREAKAASSKKIGTANEASARIASSSSNPSLMIEEQMERLVSPASRKLIKAGDSSKPIQKSRSMGTGLASKQNDSGDEMPEGGKDEYSDAEALDEVDLSELADIHEGLISPESDDSFSALADGDLSNEERIKIYNRLLSNSSVTRRETPQGKTSSSREDRPRKANRVRAGINEVSILSSSLKKSNPYLSNLNADEQLTGVISYIIKHGETIVGKSNDCDIMLHGPELRPRHAKITRKSADAENSNFSESEVNQSSAVYIEPIFETSDAAEENTGQREPALMVNGTSVIESTRLEHCDRLLFGTNSYFVFADNIDGKSSNGDTLADLDLVTYEMAKNEVLKKILAEKKNEAMIKQINDYTHRPGTGKHKAKTDEYKDKGSKASSSSPSKGGNRLTRSITIHDQEVENDEPLKEVEGSSEKVEMQSNIVEVEQKAPGEDNNCEDTKSGILESQEANYRDQLMNDTYEYALPVAEVNAVAREMGIKIDYGLKILTGEEQLPDNVVASFTDSDGFSSSSMGDGETDQNRIRSGAQRGCNDQVTRLTKLDQLDIPPALYVKVHHEDYGIDFFWSKEKFQARRYKILELYGPWDVGGKSGLVEYLIDQSKAPGHYLIDPFVDDPATSFVLIGHSQIVLEPLSYMGHIKQTFDILNMEDETVGTINVEAVPCHTEENQTESLEPYTLLSGDELSKSSVEDPQALLNKKLVFRLKVSSCRDLPQKYSNIFCQYSLNPEHPSIKTKIMREDSLDSDVPSDGTYNAELVFDHSHFICFEKITRDILDFLEHGFLTIQVVGQYKLSEIANRSPSVVSTIINSINKYKSKMEQQNSYNGMNYSSSAYYNSNTNSTKSNRGPSSGAKHSNSGASSVASTSATVNLFDQQNEDDEGINSMNGLSQENIIDMILTKRKLDRAENQLHYLKRTINIAENYNKKHIPVKTVKKLLNSYGHELDSGSLEEMAADVSLKGKNTGHKNSACCIQ